jgi:hypothetical protein
MVKHDDNYHSRAGRNDRAREGRVMRIENGPMRDGIAINLPELADKLRMSKRQTRAALAGLIDRGFIINLTPELSLDRAVFRLTMLPFQGAAPTDDYVERGQ